MLPISLDDEGNSVRATCRMTGFAKGTVLKFLVEIGEACESYQRATLRNLTLHDLQLDEIWAFIGKKQKRVTDAEKELGLAVGDAYTFTALDRNTKLVPAFLVGKRDHANTCAFLADLRDRLAPACRPQIDTDAFDSYPDAVERAFGADLEGHVQITKEYGEVEAGRGRYSPARVKAMKKVVLSGNPDESKASTSHVERQNLTMRMCMRRMTRLTNAFSKRLRNLRAAVGLHFMYYNFGRVHQTLRVTPAMEAGVADHVWTLDEIVGLL